MGTPALVVPTWALAKIPKKGRLKDANNPKKGRLKYDAKKLITPQAKQTVKQRSVLEVEKICSRQEPQVEARERALSCPI